MIKPISLLMACVLIAAVPIAGCSSGKPKIEQAESGLDLIPVTITTQSGTHSFKTEVARTDEEQQEGMMYRREMAEDAAMLFPFPQAKNASFWMHNTFVSLDMIFIREDGTIARIAEDAAPQDDSPHEAGEPVTAVLEIKGGMSAKLGIAAGDKVSWDK